MVSSPALRKWAQDVKLDLIYYFECDLNQWLSYPPGKKKHCDFPAEIIVMVKEKGDYARLNEFHSLNVLARHSGLKSYLMADTQFMAGPPFFAHAGHLHHQTGVGVWVGVEGWVEEGGERAVRDRALHS